MKRPLQSWFFYACLILSGFAVAVILYLVTNQVGGATSSLSGLFTALQPIFLGIIMTYLLFPVANYSEKQLLKRKTSKKMARALSTAIATIFMLALFFLFGYMVLPQVLAIIMSLSGNIQDMANDFLATVSKYSENFGVIAEYLEVNLTSATTAFLNWLRDDLATTLTNLASGLYNVARVALNLVIGVIVMVYVLASRDNFAGQSKKILYALCGNRKACAVILEDVRQINRIFGGFLAGKVIDSLIIGVITFFCLTILQIPYVMLISVVIGVTNIIPVFGPFIGGVPCAFLLLLIDPTKCLVFIIFIIILQQIDGNIIGPRILGESTGLPAFWVLFSLLLFQYFMGFWGMIVGVPLFASIYFLVKQLVNYLLAKRNLPLLTSDYVKIETIGEDGTPAYLDESDSGSYFQMMKKDQKKTAAKKEVPTDSGKKENV